MIMNAEQFSKMWGDNFPTEKTLPMDVIKHHAETHNLELNQDIISFAKALWNEGNLS
jgi:hypothetical protein